MLLETRLTFLFMEGLEVFETPTSNGCVACNVWGGSPKIWNGFLSSNAFTSVEQRLPGPSSINSAFLVSQEVGEYTSWCGPLRSLSQTQHYSPNPYQTLYALLQAHNLQEGCHHSWAFCRCKRGNSLPNPIDAAQDGSHVTSIAGNGPWLKSNFTPSEI